MKAKLSAVIPVGRYANISPEIEVEAETYEEALSIAESRLTEIWNRYVEPGKELEVKNTSNRKLLKAFVGGEIFYDEIAHVYTWQGHTYLSGSVYAESFKKPFDQQGIAAMMAKKVGADPSEIIKMWELKGKASRDFGSSVHEALQLYEQFGDLAAKLGKETHLHDNFVLKSVVESFYAAHKGEKAISEVLVVDHKARRAGQIDRLIVLGDKHGRVTDFKTGDASKNLPSYFKQLEFYTEIMIANGWKMESPVIYEWNGEWKTYTPPTAPKPRVNKAEADVARYKELKDDGRTKLHLMTKLQIWAPKYSTQYEENGERVVLMHRGKVFHATAVILVEFTKAKHLEGQRFAVLRSEVMKCDLGGNKPGELNLYVVPMSYLDTWESGAEVRDFAFSVFDENKPEQLSLLKEDV